MAWHIFGDKPLSELMLNRIHWRIYAELGRVKQASYDLIKNPPEHAANHVAEVNTQMSHSASLVKLCVYRYATK